MALGLTQFDGHAINGSSSYTVELRSTNPITHDVGVNLITRRNTASLLDSITVNPIEYLLIVTPTDAATAYATWKTNVQQWFSPSNSDVTRFLVGTVDDGTTAQIELVVVSRKLVRDTGVIAKGSVRYDVVVRAPWPFWESTATITTSTSPIINAGNAIALPSIAFTSAVHKSRRITTVVGAGAGGGLVSYPVLFTLNDAAATSGGTFVFIEGVSVPTYVVNSGGGTSKVWALVDTASDGSTLTHIDIVYGTGLSNPLGQTLDMGGMDATNSTNTQWQWSDFRINRWPSRPGTWRPVAAGNHNTSAQISYGIINEGSGTITFTIGTPGQYDNSADGMVLVVGSKAGSSNAITSNSVQRALAYTVDAYTISSAAAMDQAAATAATIANPTVLTAAAHGFNAGDTVTISGVSGITGLSNGTYIVQSTPAPTTNSFALAVNVTATSSPSALATRKGTNSAPNPTVVTLSTVHGLVAGDSVTISGTSGYTPSLNNTYTVLSSPAVTAHTFAVSDTVTVLGTGGTATKVHTAQAYCRYRTAGATTWVTAWSSNVSGSVTGVIDVPGAVEVMIGVENNGPTADPCTLVVTSAGNWTLNLDSSTTPTVSVAAVTLMDYYNGGFQISTGPQITLDHLLVPDGSLVIDAKLRTITPQGNGPIYAGSSNPPIQFSLGPNWAEIGPGSQSIVDTTGGAHNITAHSTYEGS